MAGPNFAGDIDIEQITIVSSSGQVFNISEIFLECNIYQNIFRHYLECDVAINDAINLQHNIKGDSQQNIPDGFRGNEYLIISYREKTDAADFGQIPLKKHIFGIYEISDRERTSEGSEVYVISGISLEAYNTSSQKINKAYGGTKGNNVSKFIESVVKEYVLDSEAEQVYTQQGFSKNVEIDETSGLDAHIIPNWSVDRTIDYFCRQADSTDHYPFYVFYEDSNGYKFKNIPKLIEDGDIDFTYSYYPFNFDTGNDVENDDQYKIVSFNTIKENNFLENLREGMFKTKSVGIDILRKKKIEKVFDYSKEQDKFYLTQGGKYPVEVNGDPVINVDFTKFGHDTDTFFTNDTTVTPKTDISLKDRRQSYRKQIFNNIIQVTIPGDSSKNVGELIDLQFYIHNDIEDTKGEIDKTLSGQYLITKVRQQLTAENLNTILECSKDSAIVT